VTDLLVIHDLGAPGGGEWADAFEAWPGTVLAPDLPGHGSAPMPLGGHHEVGDAVFHLAAHLGDPPRVVLGVGHNGHAARILALGGRATALVLVDGLGGPWLDVDGRNAALLANRRQILHTPAALAPHEPPGNDLRATMVLGSTNREFTIVMCGRITVPVLVVETPATTTPDADEVAAAFPDATVIRVDDPAPTAVAPVVLDWASSLP
jgi:pimeloyl-ACP methyl ester carboxylesterase